MTRYPPLQYRSPANHSHALSAFRRLHIYAVQSNHGALAAFAVLKALQKLEEAGAGVETDESWLKGGLWIAFDSFVINDVVQKKMKFRSAMDQLIRKHRCWHAMKTYMDEHRLESPTAASEAMTQPSGFGGPKTMVRHFNVIAKILNEANDLELVEDGLELKRVEARDLVPTQKLQVSFADD
jgi:hypothetical protein